MKRPVEGIATDAAHSMKNKKTEYQGINLATKEQIFYKDLGDQTTNIGEFLAVIEAVKFIIENDFQPRVIYTDSMTAIACSRQRKHLPQSLVKSLYGLRCSFGHYRLM